MLLQLMLLQLPFDCDTERHWALGLRTVHGMVAAQGYQLLADWAAAVGLEATTARVGHHAFHLQTAGQPTKTVAALTRVRQRLNAALD